MESQDWEDLNPKAYKSTKEGDFVIMECLSSMKDPFAIIEKRDSDGRRMRLSDLLYFNDAFKELVQFR